MTLRAYSYARANSYAIIGGFATHGWGAKFRSITCNRSCAYKRVQAQKSIHTIAVAKVPKLLKYTGILVAKVFTKYQDTVIITLIPRGQTEIITKRKVNRVIQVNRKAMQSLTEERVRQKPKGWK